MRRFLKKPLYAFVCLQALCAAGVEPGDIRISLIDDVPTAGGARKPLSTESRTKDSVYSVDEGVAGGWLPYAGADSKVVLSQIPRKAETPAADLKPAAPSAPVVTQPITLSPAAAAAINPVVPEAVKSSVDNRPKIEWRTPLSRLTGSRLPLDFSPKHPTAIIDVPMSGRELPESVTLELERNHLAIVHGDEVELLVRINDIVAARVPLQGATPGRGSPISLPPGAFRAGLNRLEITVLSRGALDADKVAPWVQINPEASELLFSCQRFPAPKHLRDLAGWFAPRAGESLPVHIAIPQSSPLNDPFLTAGALVTQGVARRMQGATPYSLSFSSRLRRDRMNVLIGTIDHVLPFLPEGAAIPSAQSPSISIYHLPGDDTSPMLVISGPDEQSVVNAAAAFSVAEFQLPDAASTAAAPPVNYPLGKTFERDASLRGPAAFLNEALSGEKADGSGLRVHLANGDPRVVMATWDFLGQMACRMRHSFPAMQITFNPPTDGSSHLYVGLVPQWSAALQSRLPLQLTAEGHVRYGHEYRKVVGGAHPNSSFLQVLSAKPLSKVQADGSVDTAADVRTSLHWRVPKEAFAQTAFMLAEKATPTEPNLLVLTAMDAGVLRSSVENLRKTAVSDFDVSRKLMLWSPDSGRPPVLASRVDSVVGDSHESQSAEPPSRDGRFSRSDYIFAGAALALILILALIAGFLLRGSGHKHDSKEISQ